MSNNLNNQNLPKNIALIGSSNLKHCFLKTKELLPTVNIYDFTIDGSDVAYVLYKIVKEYENLKNCDLIILEPELRKKDDELWSRDIKDLNNIYQILSFLKIPIVMINMFGLNDESISNYYANFYNINTLNIYKNDKTIYKNLIKDKIHLYDIVLAKTIKNICENYSKLSKPKDVSENILNNFNILTPFELDDDNSDFLEFQHNLGTLKALNIKKGNVYLIPNKYLGYNIHSLFGMNTNLYSTLKLSNIKEKLYTVFTSWPRYKALSKTLEIDNNTKLEYSDNISENIDPIFPFAINQSKKLNFFNVGDILLIKNLDKFNENIIHINELENKNTILNAELDFSHLAVDIDILKQVVSDYIIFHQPVTLAPFKAEIAQLKSNQYNAFKKIIKDIHTFRLDVFILDYTDKIQIHSEQNLAIEYPGWFKSSRHQGLKIYNKDEFENSFSIKIVSPINSDELHLAFRGICNRNKDDKILKFFINYINVKINGKSFGNFSAWHDEAKRIKMPCKKDEVFIIEFSIDTYKFNLNELELLLDEYYNISDKTILKLIYAYVNTKF